VPRAWTIYFAELTGAELPVEVPWSWLHRVDEVVREAGGDAPPTTFLDGSVRMTSERLAIVRNEARDAVESLKRHAFDLLERL
jgi:acetoin utilization protein AcuC